MNISQSRLFGSLLAAAACLALIVQSRAADKNAENEQDLIRVLQSDAPGDQKAIACKKLAIYGSRQAVPVLAPLLSNEQLSSWARIALEAIPGPAADEALRNALPRLKGRLLVGTINTIGVRRDPKALENLTTLLKDQDTDVASAAAVALGRIGGQDAAKSLQRVLAAGPEGVRAAAAEGCIRCAEAFLESGKASAAVKLYDTVRKAQVPKQKLLDATRGAILARKAKGVPLLVEQLKSLDKAFFSIALRTARELPGPEATKAVAQELRQAAPERQPLILLALADRADPAAMPTIVEAARSGSQKVRLTAVGVLERMGSVSTVPLLLECATGTDAELAQAAKASLVRLYGTEIDSAIVQQLPQSSGKTRQALVEVASRRGIEAAVPEFLKSATDRDEAVRNASLQAVGALGGPQQVPAIVGLLKQTSNPNDHSQLEQALLAICGRVGTGCVPEVQALTKDDSGAVRVIAVHALAASGGPEALAAIKTATRDKETFVQDEAVRTLSSWPNTWPEDSAITEALLEIAKNDANTTHQVLAIRGCLQYLQGDKKLRPAEKIEKLNEVLPLAQRPEEKRSAIGVLQRIQTGGSLKLLAQLAAQPAVADEACAAIVDIAGKERGGTAKEDRQKALQAVVDNSKDSASKRKAEEILKGLN